MRYSLLLLAMLALVFCTRALRAEVDINSLASQQLPQLGNLALGWVSLSGVDPTMDSLSSFAPTMLCLTDNKYRVGMDGATGAFTFGKLDIHSDYETAAATLGPGIVRVVRYAVDSNRAALPSLPATLPGVLADTNGESYEISYAQKTGTTSLGFSLIPHDNTSVHVTMNDQSLVSGHTETDYGFRIGGMVEMPNQVRVGGNFSYQRDASTATFIDHTVLNAVLAHPELLASMPAAPLPMASDRETYLTRCDTVGASWQPRPGTWLYGAYQDILSTGSKQFRRYAVVEWCGVMQQFGKGWAARANYLGGGYNYILAYRSAYGMIAVSYTDKALYSAHDVLGVGHAFFTEYTIGF